MNTANTITMIRILMIPVFMLTMTDTIPFWVPLLIFAVASLTDGIDGYVARHYNQVTTFGKFVDPLADKLLVTSALIIFVAQGIMPDWAVMIILAREFIVTSLRLVAVDAGVVIAAALSGKIKTFTQIVCILVMLTPLGLLPIMGVSVNFVLSWVMVIITVWAGIDYLWAHRHLLKAK